MARIHVLGLIVTIYLVGLISPQDGWSGSAIATEVFSFVSTKVRLQTYPSHMSQATAANLSSVVGQGGTSTEMEQKAGTRSSFVHSEVQVQQEDAGSNRSSESASTSKQKTIMPRVSETTAIRFVTNDGNDSDDGLSWGTAKRTIFGALVSLPGGGPNKAGSGTIYVGPASSANPRVNKGIWLMGPKDPNYNRPPAGWLQCNGCTVNVLGVPNYASGPNGHKNKVLALWGGGSDRDHPAIWLSATQQPIYIANFGIQYPGRAVVIGECSNRLRTGNCGVSGVVLENVSAIINATASNGPCTDITGGSFWIWMRDYGCAGNAYRAKGGPTANNSAAILIDGTSNVGNGLIQVSDANLAGGGIKVIPGSNGSQVYFRNVIQEGDFSHALPPTVWITSWSSFVDAVLDNIQTADSTGTPVVIENDGGGTRGPTVINSEYVTGPGTIINPAYFNSTTVSPKRQRETGFFNNYVEGETDVARRISGLVPSRFENKAATNPSRWSLVLSRGVLKSGVTDPYGGTGAATVTSTSSGTDPQNLQMGTCTPYTPTAGDWIVVGVWGKNIGPTYVTVNASCFGYGFPAVSATYTNPGLQAGDGQWQYQWQAYKVSGGAVTNINAGIPFTVAGGAVTLYAPVLYIIPAGTLSDNEVLEFASNMNSVDSSCEVGQICNVAGHPLVVSSYGTLSNCSSISLPAKCGHAPAGSFVLRPGSTSTKVNTTAVTVNSQIVVMEDSSLGPKLGVSCNRTSGRTYMITDRVSGVSFTVSSSAAPTEHPACLSFQLLN
jgi:hypothetical protein